MLEKKVYNDTTHKFDFSKQRVTDMKSCRRIRLPQPTDTDTEVVLANLLERVKEVTINYLDSKCYKKDVPKEGNLLKTEKEGMRSLQTKTKKSEIVVQATNKSKRLAVCSMESYNSTMQPHATDTVVS